MANGRGGKKDTSWRDGIQFISLPMQVLKCQAYINLSYPAKTLLVDLAMQTSNAAANNGQLLCTEKHMTKRGWNSKGTLQRAKKELIENGFLYETVKGRLPNRAAWYALTFYSLGKRCDYDSGAERGFKRGAYDKNPLL